PSTQSFLDFSRRTRRPRRLTFILKALLVVGLVSTGGDAIRRDRSLWHGLLPHLKRRALDDPGENRREAVVVARRVAHDRADRRLVVVRRAPSERVGQQLLGERLGEDLGAPQQRLAQADRSIHSGP